MKPGRPVDIKTLIQILSYLPHDALIYVSNWEDSMPLDLCHLDPQMGPLYLYERDGEVRLYIDDLQASHPDIDPYRSSLFWGGEAFKRLPKWTKEVERVREAWNKERR